MKIEQNTKDIFLSLIRLGIGTGDGAPSLPGQVDWPAVYSLAQGHGLTAVLVDGIDRLPDSARPPKPLLMQWIGGVLQSYEQRYELYRKAIAEMAGWHRAHGYKMMVLKGYACAMNWPRPEHRPCGDIDIWQFGQQAEADAVLSREKRMRIDDSYHHHTVFHWRGFTVENHYDFLNIHHHKSNVALEAILKDLGKDDSFSVELYGEKVYLPSPNLHALFLLRHSMSNFASTGLRLRQLLDWGFFVEKQGKDVDWPWLEDMLDRFGMKQLFQIFNAICVEDLGFESSIFPAVHYLPDLKERVINDMLSPEFSEKEKGGFIRRALFKYRRWRANAWKHELCFNESMASAFWSGVKSHLLKPSSI